MTKIEKNIKLLENCLPLDMKQDVLHGRKKCEYTLMLEVVLKSNRELFKTKELMHELDKIGINNPYEMSEYIINSLYKEVKNV